MLDLVDEIRRDEGTTIMLVTHDPEVASRADRLVYLKDGRIDHVETQAGRAETA